MLLRKGAPKEDRDPRQPGRLRRAGRWYMGSSSTLVTSGVLLLLLAAAAVYLAIVPANPRATTAPPSATESDSTTDEPLPVAPQPGLSLCPEQARVDVAPETVALTAYDTQWVPVGGALLPQSDTGGPSGSASPRACFARSPEGALYSLATFFTESLAAASVQDRIDLLQARASRTGGYEQAIGQLTADPSLAAPASGQPQVRIVGYRWLAYTPDKAQLELQYQRLTGSKAGTTLAPTVVAVWESNDWLVQVPPDGTSTSQPTTDHVVYVPWGPPA